MVRKGEIACNKQFLHFSQCFFYPIWHLFFILNALYIPLENVMRKGDIACNKQFLHFSQCFFYPIWALIFHFKCTLKCCPQLVSI